MTRSRRWAAAIAALSATALLTVGCGTEQDATPTSSSVAAQEQLRAPVSATTNDPSAPRSLSVQGASAPTMAVATDTAGVLLPPQDVSKLGWWVDSALPGGGKGTVVVTGHVDEADQGTGFAARFAKLSPGNTVEVTTANGRKVGYTIDRLVHADKSSHEPGKGLPTGELNRLDGPETLALVTCGGPFVGPPLGYRDNIIAFGHRV